VASWDDVRSIARDLPEAVEDDSGRTTAWRVGSKAFAWERLLRRGEREQLGAAAPDGPALGLRTAAPDAVDALVASRPGVFFTVAGYGVHPMVLVHVERASFDDLDEAITDAWLSRAPRRLTRAFLAWTAQPKAPGSAPEGSTPGDGPPRG
jgi:hypothetical protein